MRSFRTKIDARRQVFLALAASIERQLREAYDNRFRSGDATQASIAKKLGVNRSAVHRRLTGRSNMTVETIADMVWALDQAVSVVIYDPAQVCGFNHVGHLAQLGLSSAQEPPSVSPQALPARGTPLPPELTLCADKPSVVLS